MRAWVNGKVLDDPTAPAVASTDHGFTVGDGVFEAVKVVGAGRSRSTRHLERLADRRAGSGCRSRDDGAVRRGGRAVLEAEPLPLGRLRITYTAGPRRSAPAGDGGPTLVVVAAPMEPHAATATVATVPWPRNERGALAGLKTTSYAENVVALACAAERGAERGGLRQHGRQPVRGHRLERVLRRRTASCGRRRSASGCLAGITRGLLLEWCDVREVDEPVEVLATADEIFLASTTRDVQAVRRCDGRDLGEPGPVTRAAAAAWADARGAGPRPLTPAGSRRPDGRRRCRRRSRRWRRRRRAERSPHRRATELDHPLHERRDVGGAALDERLAVGGAQLDDHDAVAVVVEARPDVDVTVAGGLDEPKQVATEGPPDATGDGREGQPRRPAGRPGRS